MIKIERTAHPIDTVMDKKRDAELKTLRGLCANKQTMELKPLWKEERVKKFLHQSQNGKCCYCERRRDEKAETDVEHFRPKAKVKESSNHSGYWWLAYSWDNLLTSCKKCNNRKSAHFPLKDESKRAFSEKDDLKKEEPMLINPLTENPEDFISYDIPKDDKGPLMLKAIGKCARGNKTISLTGINDEELLIERADSFKNYRIYTHFLIMVSNQEEKKEIHKMIKEKIESRSKFAGLARFYFNQVGLNEV